jgi:lipopolysaccharide transport system ATP-binding protein
MSQAAITVENLGKAYRLGRQEKSADSFRDVIMRTLTAPVRRLRQMGELDTSSEDTFWALKNVCFEVPRGQVLGIVGRNGAGKSTLLKILSRIVEPTEGIARLRGRVVSLLEVGTGFHPELSGRENIYLNGAILGMRKAEIDRKFDSIVEFAEISKFLDTPVKRYSSGMYVRLAFAVAAHLEPEILIVDEVLAVGDAQFQKKCLGKMQEVAAGEGRTVLFVSHNMNAVRRLCQSAIYLKNGTLVKTGTSEEVCDYYLETSLATDGEPPIRERPRRHGERPIFTDLRIISPSGRGVTSGGAVTFEIDYESDQTIRNAAMMLYLDSEQSERILMLNTRLTLGMSTFESGRHTVRCHVDHLPLTPGSYTIEMDLYSNGRQIDHVDKAAVLDVRFADFFGTGELPNHGQGRLLVKHRWEL